ncbi:MAG: hypothetical protein A2790_03280 [Phenylobacterium sp. RIFCSPHIGHO2_01_FULL_69_31]|jgi:molybdopterin synthase sulfur carrier subunit|uniref:MoaD/ThiS family protein n=1 Tax=Phenylobacterium sp. RIFCSPHIGHO2_01_FULL_69_31 TaxID=1801944 RepID=UPI0008BCC9ED|nr:MoaD/ThiS family protein [Phenylobacterium sp. RIFCSPHIGHO2_01_FULL_69_31]OHB31843.1 MAG: hypothetical protein A2790_03280 [Phenylobacterium sp. RIFCSPHIGHO2_01_FULL_69_31]
MTTTACAPPRPAGLPSAALHVLFFGKVADQFGRSLHLVIPPQGCPLSAVKSALADLVDGGAQALSASGVRAAVAQELVLDDTAWVRPGQEVAFFSAFSGG